MPTPALREVVVCEHYDPTTQCITLFGTVEQRPAASPACGAVPQDQVMEEKIRAIVAGWSEEGQALAYLYLHGRGVNLARVYNAAYKERRRPACPIPSYSSVSAWLLSLYGSRYLLQSF